jgi:5'-3' exonuclease
MPELKSSMLEALHDNTSGKELHVHWRRIVDYLALVGDTVDNVPGVNKVGPKTAVKWLTEHGSLDGGVSAADKIGT